MLIAWTTVAEAPQADTLAGEAIRLGLAVCAQIDGPVSSHYVWEGKVENAREYRIQFKFMASQRSALETWLHRHHPYETPEWIVVEAAHVGEKYLSWALANSTHPPFHK